MKITGIETYIAGNPWKNWLFAKVTTDEGLHGMIFIHLGDESEFEATRATSHD